MSEKMTMTEVTPDNLTGMPCCGIKNIQHQGHIEKSGWLKTHFRKGLGSQVMFTEDNRQFGFIEYIPGKYAWRGIEAHEQDFIDYAGVAERSLWLFYLQLDPVKPDSHFFGI